MIKPNILQNINFSEVKKLFKELVRIMEKNGNYADVLLFGEKSFSISKDKIDISVDRSEDLGVKLRVFDGEKFNVRSITGINKQKLLSLAQELGSLNKLFTIKFKIDKSKISKHFSSKGKINALSVPISNKVNFISNLQKKVVNSDNKIINARVLYMEDNET